MILHKLYGVWQVDSILPYPMVGQKAVFKNLGTLMSKEE